MHLPLLASVIQCLCYAGCWTTTWLLGAGGQHGRSELDCRDRPANTGAWLPAERMCSCTAQLLAVLGGEAAVREWFQSCTPGDSDSIAKPFYVDGTRHVAVRAGDCFQHWGQCTRLNY
jgi:hypothetical protein